MNIFNPIKAKVNELKAKIAAINPNHHAVPLLEEIGNDVVAAEKKVVAALSKIKPETVEKILAFAPELTATDIADVKEAVTLLGNVVPKLVQLEQEAEKLL